MIRNLLFDLGGVIMDIRRARCEEAFRSLGMRNPEEFFGEYAQKGPFRAIEEGRITPDEFHTEVRGLLDSHVSDAEIDHAFNQFLIGIPEHRLRALRDLRRHYRIYMLSNTNPIMWNSRIAEEFRKEGLTREDYFDGILTSFESGHLKPSRAIFEQVLERFGINADETVFFDDSATNIAEAAKIGFGTVWVGPGTEFTDDFKAEYPTEAWVNE